MNNNRDHLVAITTDRGFLHMPPVLGTYGGAVRVYESSAACGPHLWLDVTVPTNPDNPQGPTTSATIHLTVDDAQRLAEQILFLVNHHYQREATT